MNRNGLKELREHIGQCACVSKGESDDKDVFQRFKVICGKNLSIIEEEIDGFEKFAQAKAEENIDPDLHKYEAKILKLEETYPDGGEKFEKAIKRLQTKYAEAIDSFKDFEAWFRGYMEEEIKIPVLRKFDWADLPEKISGGYLIAIEPMINNFPKV